MNSQLWKQRIMSSDAKPNQVAASIVRKPSNAARKSLSDPQAAEINEVQRTLCRNHGFLNIFSIQCNCWKCFAQSCPKGLSEAQQMCWQEMLRKCSHDMRRKCGKNAQKTTDRQQKAVVSKNMTIPTAEKSDTCFFFGVPRLWLPECLLD